MSRIFYTSRLVLTPFPPKDTHLFHQINAHPFVRKYLWDNTTISKEQAKEILLLNKEQMKLEDSGLWKIQFLADNSTIGYVGLWYFFYEKQPQLLYVLLPEFTKQGYAYEAASKIIEYAFGELDFEYLDAACDKANIPSQNLAASLGMNLIKEEVLDGRKTLFFRRDAERH